MMIGCNMKLRVFSCECFVEFGNKMFQMLLGGYLEFFSSGWIIDKNKIVTILLFHFSDKIIAGYINGKIAINA